MKKRWKKLLVIAVAVTVAESGIPFAGTALGAEPQVEESSNADMITSEDDLQQKTDVLEEADVFEEADTLEETESEQTQDVPLAVSSDTENTSQDEEPQETVGEEQSDSVETERLHIVVNGIPEYAQTTELLPVSVDTDVTTVNPGDSVKVTANDVEGYYLAQVRIGYRKAAEELSGETDQLEEMIWETLEVSNGRAEFAMPDAGEEGVTVYGDYISIVWDGTIDVTWYDPEDTAYEIQYGAQLAGAAAVANGLFNDYPVREETTEEGEKLSYPDVVDAEGNPILGVNDPEAIDEENIIGYVNRTENSGYEMFEDVDGDGLETVVVGDLKKIEVQRYSKESTGSNNKVTTSIRWLGSENYLNKTVTLTDDLDMGGSYADGTSKLLPANWSGPNYMPIGGQYAMDPGHGSRKENGYTCLSSYFLGTFNGKGHMVRNICALRHVNSGIFGNCQSVGLIGVIGHPNKDGGDVDPVVQNVAIDGIIYGNRMIGGIVGKNSYSNESVIRNCMNFATVYNTDAKGCGGIAGAGWENLIVENCANFGLVCTGYDKNAGGLVGSSEALVFDSYTLGYASGEGKGNENAGQALGTNNGGAVWYNCYALKGGGSGTRNEPGTATETVYGATFGSAIRVLEKASDYQSDTFLSLLNGKVKNGGPDKTGYMDSDDDVVPNTKRNWVRGEQKEGETEFISANLEGALKQVSTWHDPSVTLTDKSLNGIAASLTALDATGVPVPRTFVHDASSITNLSYTGTPTLSYYSGETFEAGDLSNPSNGPSDTDKGAAFAIWASFDDGTWQEIEDYDVIYENGGDAFTAEDQTVTVKASYLGKTFEKTFDIEVTACSLLSLKVSASPQNTFYAAGETLDPNGLILTADYGIPATSEGEADTIINTIMAQYTDNRIILTRKRKSSAMGDQSISYEEMEISGEAANAYEFRLMPDDVLSAEDKAVTVSHTFNGETLTTSFPITVMASEAPRLVKDGDQRTVYIASENDFLWFENQISSALYPTMDAVLEADITISDTAFAPIGYRTSTVYQGTFFGWDHTITLNAKRSGVAGLFFDIGENAVIKDLTIEGSIAGTSNVGGIACYLDGGSIYQCTNKAKISGSGYNIGGIAGCMRASESKIEACTNSATVSGSKYVGGIVGKADGSYEKIRIGACKNEVTGTVTGQGDAIGGIAGSFGTNTGSGKEAGYLYGSTNQAKISVVGSNLEEYAVGGVVGRMKNGVVGGCRNTGELHGSLRTAMGGIAGVAAASTEIISAYNTGALTIEDPIATSTVGGVGGIAGRTLKGTVLRSCYNTGLVSSIDGATEEIAAFAYLGALIGNAKDISGVTNNYVLENALESLIAPATIQYTAANGASRSSDEIKILSDDLNNGLEDGESRYENRTDCYPALSDWEEKTHDTVEEMVITKEATCTESGRYHVVKKCAVCGEIIETGDEQELDMTAHTEAAPVKENEIAATPTAHGSYDEVVYCTECGKEISRETIVVHYPGESKITDEKPATCEQAGSYVETINCAVCGEEYSKETKTIPRIDHEYGDWVITEPTCEADGKKVRTCTICHRATESEVLPAIGHDYGDWEPYNSVQHKRVCKHDASHVELQVHNWDDGKVTKKATASAAGVMTYTCADCGETKQKTIVAQTMTVSGKNQSVGYATLLKSAKTYSLVSVAGNKGKLSYKKGSGSSSYATVDAAAGKITLKKGTPAGTHTVNVVVTSGATTAYEQITQTVPVKITVTKAAQPMTIAKKTVSVKYTKVKKAKQTIKKSKIFTIKKNQGSVSFKKTGGSGKISISKAGAITVKKGTKKGTYKIKVKATAKGNSNYNAGSKTVTVSVKVK